MPLGVVTASGPGTKSVFEKLNPFVDKLVNVYKQKKQNEYDNEFIAAYLLDIENPGSKKDIENAISKKDPPEGYMDIENATKFFDEAVGMLQQKEVITGGLPPTTTPQVEGIEQQQQTEVVPDEKELMDLFQFISEIPTGNNWDNTKAVYKKRLESGRAVGALGKSILSMIMGQGQIDQRAKFEQDYNLASKMKEELYPETEEEGVIFDPEQFKKDNPDMEISGYNSNTGGYTFKRKEEEEEEEGVFDWKNFLEENKDWQIKTINSKGDVTVGRKTTTTKKWEFDTWQEAQEWTKAHPQEGYEWKIETQGEGFNVTAMKKTTPTPEPGTKKIVPTYGVIQTINEDILDPTKDPNRVRSQAGVKYDFSNKDTGVITNEERANKYYNEALTDMNDPNILDQEGYLQKPFEAGNKTIVPTDIYNNMYNLYEQGAKEYYEATGELLPKQYLSLEEAGKYTSLTAGTGYKGGYKPVLNEANIPWNFAGEKTDRTTEFVKEMLGRGGTLDDYNPEELEKLGVDIEKAKQLISQLGR